MLARLFFFFHHWLHWHQKTSCLRNCLAPNFFSWSWNRSRLIFSALRAICAHPPPSLRTPLNICSQFFNTHTSVIMFQQIGNRYRYQLFWSNDRIWGGGCADFISGSVPCDTYGAIHSVPCRSCSPFSSLLPLSWPNGLLFWIISLRGLDWTACTAGKTAGAALCCPLCCQSPRICSKVEGEVSFVIALWAIVAEPSHFLVVSWSGSRLQAF